MIPSTARTVDQRRFFMAHSLLRAVTFVIFIIHGRECQQQPVVTLSCEREALRGVGAFVRVNEDLPFTCCRRERRQHLLTCSPMNRLTSPTQFGSNDWRASVLQSKLK